MLDGNDGETIEQCVMRWDKIDDEGVYLENCCFTDSRKKGDGLGLGRERKRFLFIYFYFFWFSCFFNRERTLLA